MHHSNTEGSSTTSSGGFVIPSLRIPIAYTATTSSDWVTEGNVLWDRCTQNVPTLLTEVTLLDMTAGLERLQTARMNIYQVLTQQQHNGSAEVESLQNALLSYAVLLQTCRQELESILAPSSDQQSQQPTAAGSDPSGQSHNEASMTSLDNESTMTANTTALLEESLTDVLLLQWKDTGNNNDTDNNDREETIFVRPPVPLAENAAASSNNGSHNNTQHQNPHHFRVLQLWMWLLHWEESHVYWNLSLTSMSQALALPKDSRPAWKQAGTHWQTAAAWMQYLRTGLGFVLVGSPQKSNEPTVRSWETWMMAEAQRAAYQFVFVAPRPSPLMAAKIAAGAVPLYAQADTAFDQAGGGVSHSNNGTNESSSHVLSTNSDVCKAWNMALSAVSEYHQASVHSTKPQQWPQAMARVNRAIQLGRLAQEFFHSLLADHGAGFELETNQALAPPFLQELQQLIQTAWPAMRELQQTLSSSEHAQNPAIVETLTLPDIPPQNLIKIQAAQTVQTTLSKVSSSDPAVGNLPLFPRMNETAQRYRLAFSQELHQLWQQTTQSADSMTNQARQSLAQVDLPNSLTRYQQDMGGGEEQTSAGDSSSSSTGHPDHTSTGAQSTTPTDRAASLWQRVERIQQGRHHNQETTDCNDHNPYMTGGEMHNIGLSELTQGLWELRDSADQAHDLVREIKRQLEENVSLDQEFAQANPTYESMHDVEDIQSSFWRSLKKYDQLLQSAASGDEVLFGRLEHLPTDPKFQLLSRLTRSQVERLVMGAAQDNPNAVAPASQPTQSSEPTTPQPSAELQETVERLNQGLLALSALFETRVQLVSQRLPEEMQMAIREASQALWKASGDEAEMERLIQNAQPSVQGVLDEIRSNLQQQSDLMEEILRINERFQTLMEQQQDTNRKPAAAAAAASATASTERAESSGSMGAAERTLVMLEDALEEMEQFTAHWQQGEVFYQGVIPKLQKLQQQVSEVSTRLAIGRCDYNDQLAKSAQEAKDAAMAAAMADQDDDEEGRNHNSDSDNSAAAAAESSSNDGRKSHNDNTQESDGDSSLSDSQEQKEAATTGDGQSQRQRSRRQSRPSSFVQQVRNDETPSVQVDDEKVAYLVAMEFDPEQVVKSLEKYDNNVDQALNELLSG